MEISSIIIKSNFCLLKQAQKWLPKLGAVPPGDVLEAGGLLHHVNHVPYVPIYLIYSLGLVW